MKRIFAPSETRERAARRLGWALALLVLVLDQWSKYEVIETLGLREGETIRLLPVFSLTFVWNEGISLGMFQQGSEAGRWFLVAVTSLIAAFLGYWLLRLRERLPALAIGLILGGAIGNIIDRIRFGAVADFLHLHIAGWSFYIFNVADAAITVGVIVLLLEGLFGGRRAED